MKQAIIKMVLHAFLAGVITGATAYIAGAPLKLCWIGGAVSLCKDVASYLSRTPQDAARETVKEEKQPGE